MAFVLNLQNEYLKKKNQSALLVFGELEDWGEVASVFREACLRVDAQLGKGILAQRDPSKHLQRTRESGEAACGTGP